MNYFPSDFFSFVSIFSLCGNHHLARLCTTCADDCVSVQCDVMTGGIRGVDEPTHNSFVHLSVVHLFFLVRNEQIYFVFVDQKTKKDLKKSKRKYENKLNIWRCSSRWSSYLLEKMSWFFVSVWKVSFHPISIGVTYLADGDSFRRFTGVSFLHVIRTAQDGQLFNDVKWKKKTPPKKSRIKNKKRRFGYVWLHLWPH